MKRKNGKGKGKRRTFPAHKDVPVVVVVDPRMNIYMWREHFRLFISFLCWTALKTQKEEYVREAGTDVFILISF